MSIEEAGSVAVPPRNAYGLFFRERATLKIVIAALVAYGGYIAFGTFQTYRAFQVKWPQIPPSKQGLIVLGLLDRPNTHYVYKAIEANHAWQIRYSDDAESGEQDDSNGAEQKDRGADAGSSHRASRGLVVPLDELFAKLPVVLHGPNFTSANVEEKLEPLFDRKYWVVNVSLNQEGHSRYYQFSKNHDGERLAFILNGEALTCPRIRHMDVSDLTIEQFWIKADADKLADFINNQKR
jgi:preprotein translocase subunit SecD